METCFISSMSFSCALFQSNLRGMETMPSPASLRLHLLFQSNLRGMETRRWSFPLLWAFQAFQSNLRGMETQLNLLFTHFQKLFQSNLRGMETQARQIREETRVPFQSNLRGMETRKTTRASRLSLLFQSNLRGMETIFYYGVSHFFGQIGVSIESKRNGNYRDPHNLPYAFASFQSNLRGMETLLTCRALLQLHVSFNRI